MSSYTDDAEYSAAESAYIDHPTTLADAPEADIREHLYTIAEIIAKGNVRHHTDAEIGQTVRSWLHKACIDQAANDARRGA